MEFVFILNDFTDAKLPRRVSVNHKRKIRRYKENIKKSGIYTS
jgi:hypothetical protein